MYILYKHASGLTRKYAMHNKTAFNRLQYTLIIAVSYLNLNNFGSSREKTWKLFEMLGNFLLGFL